MGRLANNKCAKIRHRAQPVVELAFGYPYDKAEGMVLTDDGRTIAVSNDDDCGVTDDGNQPLI